jgi:hypothetical protein
VYRKDLVKKDGSDAFLLDAYVRSLLAAGIITAMLYTLLHVCPCFSAPVLLQQPANRVCKVRFMLCAAGCL